MSFFTKKNNLFVVALLVGCFAFLIYLPTLDHEFVNWDDPEYILKNENIQSLDSSSLKWMFTSFYSANWHPLTWFSHSIDFKIWGQNPRGHHLSNIICHAINSSLVVILVFYLVSHASGSRPKNLYQLSTEQFIIIAVSGLCFALHPLHVETVAWVTERKDLLCTFFFLLSLIFYIKYTTVIHWKIKGLVFFCSLLSAMLALMCKPMAVTIPAVLLLLDLYPLNRINLNNIFISNRKVILEKVPFLLLSLSSSIITLIAQKSWGAMSSFDSRPLDIRFLVAIKASCFYLLKILFPTNLSPLYPYPNDISLLDLKTISSIILILTVFGICIVLWKKHKAVPIALSYFLITLIPVLGVIQVGGQSAADRYTYLPSIGPFILIGLGVATMIMKARKGKDQFNTVTYLVIFITAIFLCFNLTLTLKQSKHWKNSVSLWDRVISIYPDQSWVAYYNRASAFSRSKNHEKAIKDFSKVIDLNPYYAYGHYRRGKSHLEARDFHKSIRDLSKAILLDKTKPLFYYYRAQAYRGLGESKKAYRDSATAIRLKSSQNR